MFLSLLPVPHVSFPLRFFLLFFSSLFSRIYTFVGDCCGWVAPYLVCTGGVRGGMSKPRSMLHRFRALLDFKCLSPSVDELIFPVSSPLFLVDYSFFVFSFILLF